jgi:hypothetical protein
MSLKQSFVLLACLFILSCNGVSEDSTPSAVVDNTDSEVVGDVDTTAFWVKAYDTGEYLVHTRSTAAFGTECKILKAAGNTDLECIVDINEGDLFYHGLKLHYNVPPEMCAYLRRSPYWYWNYEVGVGPSTLEINITKDANSIVTASDCTVNGGAADPGCDDLDDITVDTASGEPTCTYDQSDFGRPNCCFGDYTINTNITADGVLTSTTANGSWGGSVLNCIGGAGKTSWDLPATADEAPGSEYTWTRDSGLNLDWTLKSPISTTDGQHYSIANYYTTAGTPHSHAGFVSATVSTLPYFTVPIDDRDGDSVPSGNGAYTFECLDEGHEIKHRIRVYVRDWDAYADYLAYISTSGVTAVPDREPPDVEPGNCDGLTGNCDDYFDLDDFLEQFHAGTYDTSDPATRSTLFPAEEYE